MDIVKWQVNLPQSIKLAKCNYAFKITCHLNDNWNAKCMCQQIQEIMDYKIPPSQNHSTLSKHGLKHRTLCQQGNPPSLKQVVMHTRKTLSRFNPCKAVGPDNMMGVLRDCANQLAEVLLDIFNTSLS